MTEKVIFKWNGEWHTLYDHLTDKEIKKNFGKPVTSVKNLGVWKNGHFTNCRIGDYVVKKNNQYGVKKHE